MAGQSWNANSPFLQAPCSSTSTDISDDDQIVTFSVEAVSGDWFSVVARDGRQQWRLISNAVYVQD
jgi:hypothetical protein